MSKIEAAMKRARSVKSAINGKHGNYNKIAAATAPMHDNKNYGPAARVRAMHGSKRKIAGNSTYGPAIGSGHGAIGGHGGGMGGAGGGK